MPHHLSKWNEDMCKVKALLHDFATYSPKAFAASVLEILPEFSGRPVLPGLGLQNLLHVLNGRIRG